MFERHFNAVDFDDLIVKFNEGAAVDVGSDLAATAYVKALAQFDGLAGMLGRLGLGEDEAAIASGMEFIFEGLHLSRRLNRDRVGAGFRYHA